MRFLDQLQRLRLYLLVYTAINGVSSSFVNFDQGYEYLYNLNSTIELRSVQTFLVKGQIGFVNIEETDGFQELLLIVYGIDSRLKGEKEPTRHHQDFSRWFSFEISHHGEVRKVYHPLDEDDEVLTVKKGLAGMLSAKLHHRHEIQHEKHTHDSWSYKTNETGREGFHNATYKVHKTSSGYEYTKTRTSMNIQSVNGNGTYEKVLHYHEQLNTIHSVSMEEELSFDFSSKKGFNPFQGMRPVQSVSGFSNIEFPSVTASSKDRLVFMKKRQFSLNSAKPIGIAAGYIHLTFERKKDAALQTRDEILDAHMHIVGNLSCIRQRTEKGSGRVETCFHNLVQVLDSMPEKELEGIADDFFRRMNRTVEDRNIMADAFVALKAQSIIVKKILNNVWINEEFLMRVLTLLTALDDEPIQELLSAVEKFCFKGTRSDNVRLSQSSRQISCLTFGGLIGSVHKYGQSDHAEKLVKSLHNELGLHDPWTFKMKRSTMTEVECVEYDHNKVILLDAIGNAGLPVSFEYIVSHINSTNSQWIKRTGIHALRSFQDAKTLQELERAALYDEDDVVRYEALMQYKAHPLASVDNTGDRNVIEHTGLKKRSIFDAELAFKLEAPGVDWQKQVGSRSIGASFGLIMENLLDLKISLLKGGIDVRVHDEAYVKVHLGFIDMNINFFLARICFKGGAKYEVNILKELDPKLGFNLQKQFTSVVNKVVGAIKKGVEAFKRIISTDFSLKKIVDDFVTSVTEIPKKITDLASSMYRALEKLATFKIESLPPFIKPVEKFVDTVASFYEKVKGDVMKFYNSIVQAVTVVIPKAAEEVFNAVQDIISGFMNIFKDPKTSLSKIGTAVLRIYTQIKILNDTKSDIMTHTFIREGIGPYWIDLTEEVEALVDLYKDAAEEIRVKGLDWLRATVEQDIVEKVTKGKTSLKNIKQKILAEIQMEIKALLDQLDSLKNLGVGYLKNFQVLFDCYKDLREAFEVLKKGYEFAKSLVNRIFGPKFHKDFPRTKRVSGGECSGDGFYPAKLGNGHDEYESEGVDLLNNTGEQLVAPFSGTIIRSTKDNEIILRDIGDLPPGSELLITNVDPESDILQLSDSGYDTKRVSAGVVIGTVSNSPCSGSNHIHVSIRRDGGYVDPSNYIPERPIVLPKWTQICDDYKLVYKDVTIVSGVIVGPLGRKEENTSKDVPEDKSLATDIMDESDRPAQDVQEIKHDENGMYSRLSNSRRRRNVIKTLVASLETLVDNIKGFLKRFSIRRLKMGEIIQFLDDLGLAKTKEKMAKLMQTVKRTIDKETCGNPYHMTDEELENALLNRGKHPKNNRDDMIKQLLKFEHTCPFISFTLPTTETLYCTLDEKCLGLECCLTLEAFDMLQKTFRAYVRLDPDPLALSIGIDSWNFVLNSSKLVGEVEDVLKTKLKFDFLDNQEIIIKYKIHYSVKGLKASIGIGLCDSEDIDECITYIDLLKNAFFPLPSVNPDGTISIQLPDFQTYVDDLNESLVNGGESLMDAATDIAVDKFLKALGIDDSILLDGPPCRNPEKLEHSELLDYFNDRSLSTDGTREDLIERYWNNELSCSLNGKDIKLPVIPFDFLHYYISDNCMRIDACADVTIEGIDFSRSFSAFVELDPCRYVIKAAFERWNKTIILFEYDWGKDEHVKLAEDVFITFRIDKDGMKKVFKVALGVKIGAADINVKLIEDFEVPIPVCSGIFSLQEISYDFWKQPVCTVTNDTTNNTEVCGEMPEELQNICSWTGDCSGIQCCSEFYFGENTRNILLKFSITCDDKFQYSIENKKWTTSLPDEIGPIHVEIADTFVVDMNLTNRSPTTYLISVTILVCTDNQGTYGCRLNFRLNQTLTKPRCNTRKRRSITNGISLDVDIKEAVKLLISQGAPAADIQKFIDEALLYQNDLKSEVWQVEELSDSDSSTGYAAAVKALGENNPHTLKHSRYKQSLQLDVGGADDIIQMIGSANAIVNRADQLFIVGSGLTEEGIRWLGAQLANMTIGDLEAMLQVNKVDPSYISELLIDLIDLAKALYSEVVDKLFSGELENPFQSFELTLKGKFAFPRRYVNFFKLRNKFPIGFISLTFGFGANGYYGLDLGWEGKLIARTAAAVLSPYGGLTCYGEVGIGFKLYVKMRLEGSIIDLRFPSRAEIGFSKFPLDVSLMMDLELIPVKLRLSVVVTLEIKFFIIKIRKTLLKKDIWHYTTPSINKRMIDVSTKEEDESPPQFSPVISHKKNNRERRSNSACDIRQIKNRDSTEPAFEISVAAADDRSDVKFFLDVGTFPGGSNIVKNRQLGGSSTVLVSSMDDYPTGVPLYFTVFAENSAGTRVGVSCMLSTYDTTVPTARIIPSFLTTSNPKVIKASALIHDDTEITTAYIGYGFGKGSYGDQLIPWRIRNLKERNRVVQGTDPLSHFSEVQGGKLVSSPIKILTNIATAAACARSCLDLEHCVSFNYDYSHEGICELLHAIRQYDDNLAEYGLFSHFERLSSGHSLEIFNDTLNMQHNNLHFINADLQNILGYRSLVSSEGILTDFICPEPGYIVNASKDTLSIDDCFSLIPPDRTDLRRFCIGIYEERLNHRTIIDGVGSRTVFNGDKPMLDLKYTRSNNYIAGNWDGITDHETGIRAYAFAVGRHICEDSIHQHYDPNKHLMHESQWTNMAVITATGDYNPFPLESGKYYLSVRAINKVEYGGPLVTTICHSTPYIIDITSPVIYEIFNIKYDDIHYILSAEQNSTDAESGIDFIELCIGDNPRNCDLLSWTRRPLSQIINFTYHIEDGISAWIQLRVTNNVELQSVKRADQAIIVDASPPLPGTVYDGPLLGEDLQFTKYSNKICSNWKGFFDPESGIRSYEIGVGTEPGLTDIVGLKRLQHQSYSYCVSLDERSTLKHESVYFTVIWAKNGAVNQRNVSLTSNGVRVDLTKPVGGTVVDGIKEGYEDLRFSSSKSTVQLQWDNFHDPESGIREYDVQVARKRHGSDWVIIKHWTKFDNFSNTAAWRNFDFDHTDEIKSTVKATNGALNDVEAETDGFIIDQTSPVLEFLNDGSGIGRDIEFQVDATTVYMNFKVKDPESGVLLLRFQIHEQQQGTVRQFYPGTKGQWIEIDDGNTTVYEQKGLTLVVGHKYISRLVAVNGAGLISTYETNGFIIENTPPEIHWIRVGVLSGLEHLIDGYVYQSDPNGIKVCWSASDPQSGITAIQYAVGTTKGSTDIMPWRETEVTASSAYLPCSLNVTDTEGSKEHTYFVSLKARNGAGLWSTVKTSSPIVVEADDVTGTVIDGPYEHLKDDVDYLADIHTITVSFSGFESSLHGITAFEWAIGTSPGAEDVQPFVKDGIIHTEEENDAGNGITSYGFAQTAVDLDHGITYYTSLKARTNNGNILQATTNGFIVDTTPPGILFNKLSKTETINSNDVIYQGDMTVLEAKWNFTDYEHLLENYDNIESTWFSVGSLPFSEDIFKRTYQNISTTYEGSLPAGEVKPALAGKTNLVTVAVTNKAGIEKKIVSPPVIQDNTAPVSGTVKCPEFVQSHSVIECKWSGFFDKESEIEKYYFVLGSQQGYDDLMSSKEITGRKSKFSAKDVKKGHADVLFATVTAENKVGLKTSSYSEAITVDNTPPSPGTVIELPSVFKVNPIDVDKTIEMNTNACTSEEECSKIDAVCIEAFTHLGVAWTHFSDDESEITGYQLAIGTTPGGAQVSPFISISPNINHYTVKNINMKGLQKVFATIKAFNFAGLSTVAHSNGVYLSYLSQGLPPLKHIGVFDSHQHAIGDVEFQSETNAIEAKWDVSGDPCPVLKYEWSVEETDGSVLQNYTDMYTTTHGRTDQLDLIEGRRYYSLVRVQNMLGFIYTLRSDGVTVKSNSMLPGMVYDGDITGYDLKVLSSRTMVSANWEGFGELRQPTAVSDILTGNKGVDQVQMVNAEQRVVYYEVALGTDRRFDKTRDNVVPFTNVGLNTSVIFKDLNLQAGFAVYYFTVRAYSESLTSATVTSNGFYVNYDGGVSSGSINMPTFVNSNTQIDVRWNGFSSNVGIMLYYIAISDHVNSSSMDCRRYVDGGKANETDKIEKYNVYHVTSVGTSTYLRIVNLTLTQNATYFLWIMGVDKAGECNMTYHKFTVDITKPENGTITAGPYFNMALAYAKSNTEIPVTWKGFNDSESGIAVFNLSLWHIGQCSSFGGIRNLLETVEVLGNYTEYIFTNQTIETSMVYRITIRAINRAKLVTTAETSPIVFDDTVPTAGRVSEGSEFTDDLVWWGFTDHMQGCLLHSPVNVSDSCPSKKISMSDAGWRAVDLNKLNDPDGVDWKLQHREVNIQTDTFNDEVIIKIARDSKAERIHSAAYMRNADMKNGGSYELFIRAADGDGMAVTGVTFWDGDDSEFHIFSHQTKTWNDHGDCSCCLEHNITNCFCNCTEILSTPVNSSGFVDENAGYNYIATSAVIAQQSCGLQIYADESPYLVTWCKFFNNTGESMSVRSEVDFNPSSDFHHFRILFFTVKEDLLATSCIRVFTDGKQRSEMCGIPPLGISTKLILHVWNKDNIVPSLDIFNLWQAKAVFKQLVMPQNVNALCRYGDPFQGGTNAIVRYEAGIGTSSGKVDMAPFQQVYEPCIPCVDLCSHFVCDRDCISNGYTLIQFTVQDVQLNASYEQALYITVKAVLESGADVVTSSNGFYIDTTPPVFDEEVLMYIDVRQGEYTPTEFQGSNSTIKAIWLCNDDKSEIEEYKWAIGTEVGLEDIQSYMSTGAYSTGMNDTLEGKLKHNSTYYVSIKCRNAAGLTTTWEDQKGVTAVFEAPDSDSVKAYAVGAEHFDNHVYPSTAVKSADSKACGASWTVSTDPNVRRYDFCVGSSMKIIDDIIPCVWVGYNVSGMVEIKHGRLFIDNIPYVNISELRALSEGMYDYSVEDDTDNTFNMESGRTLFLFMRLCNKAEICVDKFVNSLLITNDKSVLMSNENGERKSYQLSNTNTNRKKRSSSDLVIEMPDDRPSGFCRCHNTERGMENGQSILYNALSEEDYTVRYDSVASTIFKPFIVNPSATINKTERLLNQRIHSFILTFTLSPVGQTPLPGPLKLSYPPSNVTDGDTENMIIHWNPDYDQWQITNRTCTMLNNTDYETVNEGFSLVLICNTRLLANQSYLAKETQFAVATVASNTINNPPLFRSTSIEIDEDTEDTQFQLFAHDIENDLIIFRLKPESTTYPFGSVSLTEDGILTVSLCQNCYGNSSVAFILEDKPVSDDISPASAQYSLDLDVKPVNDPPIINVFSPNGINILPRDPTEAILIFREQERKTITGIIAIVIIYDVDGPQILQIKNDTGNASGSFALKGMQHEEIRNQMSCDLETCVNPVSLEHFTNAEMKGVYISYTNNQPSFVGMDSIKIVAQDETGTFSDVITVTAVVMENKCQHGHCKSLNPQQYSCTDTKRAQDFDLYYTCECPKTWTGAYCEQDVDECALGFCEAWKVCQNTLGSYDCYCKPTYIICKLSLENWEFSVILIAIVLVLLVVLVLILRKYKSTSCVKRKGKKHLWPFRCSCNKVTPVTTEECGTFEDMILEDLEN